MSDLTVILDRRKMVVRMDSKTIRIDRPGSRPERVPLNMIGRVIVIGSPMVSCDVWRSLTQENIPAILIPSRGNGVTAYMGSGLTSFAKHRVAQYRAFNDKQCAADIARWLVSEKMLGQMAIIKELAVDEQLSNTFCEQVKEYHDQMLKADCRERIMGFEGVAAAAYFKVWGKILPEKWKFSGRNRRPPKDPVNALLSLSYTISGGEVRRAVQIKGLDPSLGFLHSPQPGRESLILDILEPIRPKVDLFVLRLLDESLTWRDFTVNEQDGCLLNKKGRKTYYKAWANWMRSEKKEKNPKHMSKDVADKLVGFFPDFPQT